MSISLSKNLTESQSFQALQVRVTKQRALVHRDQFGGNLMGIGAVLALTTAGIFWISEPSMVVPVIHHLLENKSVMSPFATLTKLLHGARGVALIASTLLIGMGLGVAKNSVLPILTSLTFAALFWGTPIMLGALSDTGSGAFGNVAIGGTATASKVILAPELLSANRLAYMAVRDKKKLTPSEWQTFHQDMAWLESHPVKAWSNAASLSLSNKERYLMKLTYSVGERHTPAVDQYLERQKMAAESLGHRAGLASQTALVLMLGALVLRLAAFQRKRILHKLSEEMGDSSPYLTVNPDQPLVG